MGHDLSKDVLDYEEKEYAFVGRQNEVNEIKQMLETRNIVQICGMTKIGKSRLLMQLLKQFYEHHTCFYHDFEGSVETEKDVINVTAEFKGALDHSTGDPNSSPTESSNNVKGAIRSLVNRIESCSTKLKKGFLFLDNVQTAFKSKNIQDYFLSFLYQICGNQACSLKVVFTTSAKVGLINPGYGELEIGRMDDDDIDWILRTIVKKRGEQIDSFDLAGKILSAENEIYIETIVKQCEGLPMAAYMVATELTADEGMLTPRDMVQLLLTQRLKSLSLEYYPREDRLDLYQKEIENVKDLDVYFFRTLNQNLDTENKQKTEHLKTEMTRDNDKTRLEIAKCFKLLTQPCIIKHLGKTEQLVMHGIFRECICQMTGNNSIDDDVFRSLLIESAKRYNMDLTDKEVENPRLLEEYVICMAKRDKSVENECSVDSMKQGTESAVTKLEKHDDTEDKEEGKQLNILVDDILHTDPNSIQHTGHMTFATKNDTTHSSLQESDLTSKQPVRYNMNGQNDIVFCRLNQNMENLKCLDSVDDNNAVLSVENDSDRMMSDLQVAQTGFNVRNTETAFYQGSLTSEGYQQAMSYSVNIMSNNCAMNNVNEPGVTDEKLSNNNVEVKLKKSVQSTDSIENNEDQPWGTICSPNPHSYNSNDCRIFPVLDEEAVQSSTENSVADSTVPVFSTTGKQFVLPYRSSLTIQSLEDNEGQPARTTFSSSDRSSSSTVAGHSYGFEYTKEPVEHIEEENDDLTFPKDIQSFESNGCVVS